MPSVSDRLNQAVPARDARSRSLAYRWPFAVIKRDALVIVWFLLVSGYAVAPLLPDPRNVVLGELGDNVHYAYMAGWTAQALLIGESPFIDPRLNYPDDLALSTNDWPYVSYLLVSPGTWLLGPVFGYNAAIFLSHFLSGYFTYLWARKKTLHSLAAVFAGTAFMLTPFRIFRSLGHAHIVSTQMIPLFFWTLDTCVGQQKPRERQFWLLGAATFLVAGSSQYLLVICLVTGAFYTLFALLPNVRLLLGRGSRLAVSVAGGALVGALPYISVLGGGLEPFDVARTRLWSADPINFILPSSMHPLWGSWVDSIRPEIYPIEKTLYVGSVALVLAGVCLYSLKRQVDRRLILLWTATALTAAVFALGTDLWIANQPLSERDPLWLPTYYLAKLPFLRSMRVWSRFGIVTIFFVAMLAGYGIKLVVDATRSHVLKRAVPLALLLALLLDLLPGSLPHTVLQAREVDRWLAQQPGDFAVAFLPVDKFWVNDRAIFGSLFHGKQMPAYLHPSHVPRAYKDFAAMAIEFPSQRSIDYLRWRDLKYLVMDTAEYNGWRAAEWSDMEARLRAFPEIELVTQIDHYVILSLD